MLTKAQSPAELQSNGARIHMPPHVGLLITKKELAKRLGVCIPTVTAYVRKRIIPGVVAGTRRYSWLAVEETLKLPRASTGRPTEAEAAERALDEDVMRHG